MKCVPMGKVAVLNTAAPDGLTAAVPRTVLPSLKVTVPVGAGPMPAARATVAVKTMAWPAPADAGLEVRPTVVGAGVTTTGVMAWLIAAEVEPLLVVSPP